LGILGNVGNLYMTILIILLMLGFGFSGLWLLDYVINSINPSNKTNIKTKGSGTKVK
jgi:hypothetical protein